MLIRWGLTGTVPKEQFEFQSILAGIGPAVNRYPKRITRQRSAIPNACKYCAVT